MPFLSNIPIAAYIVSLFVASGVFVHFRGKRKFGFFRQIFDHSTFMGPINIMMYAFSKVPNTPYVDVSQVPSLHLLRENWETIREEALNLQSSQTIKGSDQYNDIGFNSFFRRGWKRFYIKWYSKRFHSSAYDKCPKTIQLIEQIPSIKAAMFVVLPAGSRLPGHRDPYAGSLRYHLGLDTPNSEDCFIDVDGQEYYWKDGDDVLFDETYLHHARNNTEKDRLIFFCDIKRPMKNKLGMWLNDFFGWFILAAAKSPNDSDDGTGNINKAFKYLYQIRVVGKKLKEYNKNLYYVVKYTLFAGIIYLIFL
jgi:beta-hydroxylase